MAGNLEQGNIIEAAATDTVSVVFHLSPTLRIVYYHAARLVNFPWPCIDIRGRNLFSVPQIPHFVPSS